MLKCRKSLVSKYAVYFAIESSLSSYERALITLNSDAESSLIVSALEDFYMESSLNTRFVNLMKRAIRLFIERRDGSLLLDLVEYGDWGDPSYDLMIGDLYYSLNNIEEARRYWLLASNVYPREAQIRLSSIALPL